MRGRERRFEILALLEGATMPIAGSEIARRCGVSRQVIVQDMAVIRASNSGIASTYRGYVVWNSPKPYPIARQTSRRSISFITYFFSSFLSRITNRIGVPRNPNVSRIRFSRKRW